MNRKVVIIGDGGHGKVIADIVRRSGDFVVGFLDDAAAAGEKICGIPVLGEIAAYTAFTDCEFVIGIGNSELRQRIAERLREVTWYTAIHPTAVVSDFDVTLGEGTVIMANAVIQPSATIGKHCIINTSSVVEHNNTIDDFSHISVGAKLGGNVHIGLHTWIGIGATVSNGISICDRCMIGAGAVVVKSITTPGTYLGVPAKLLVK